MGTKKTRKKQLLQQKILRDPNRVRLEKLKEMIISDVYRRLFSDIIRCYDEGLLRAGFLLGWLTLVEEVKERISSLADNGMNAAEKSWESITKLEESHKSVDEKICEEARKCEIIDDDQLAELTLLWNKRCIMGHPYIPEVMLSDFMYMAEKLVEICLSRPLMWPKSMIESYFEDIKKAPHLIPIGSEERKRTIENKLSFIPERLFPFFWKTLFFELSKSTEDGNANRQNFLMWMAVRFLIDNRVDINAPQYSLAIQVRDYPQICWTLFYVPKVWQKTDSEYQNQLFRYLANKESNSSLYYAKSLIARRAVENEVQLNHYYSALERLSLESVYKFYVNKDLLFERIERTLISTMQFSDQGDYIDLLKTMDSDIVAFSSSEKQKLGAYLAVCCANNTYRAHNYVTDGKGNWMVDNEFVLGFAERTMTDNGEIHINVIALRYMLIILTKIHQEERTAIVKHICEIPVKEKSKDSYSKDRAMILQEEYLKDDTEEGGLLKAIIENYYEDEEMPFFLE